MGATKRFALYLQEKGMHLNWNDKSEEEKMQIVQQYKSEEDEKYYQERIHRASDRS